MKDYEVPKSEEMTVQEERAAYGKEKPKSKDTARLIWASKPKKEPNAKELEFQTAEEVYPNVADVKDKKLLSFVAEKREISEQPNRLIWGDNLLVMQALLAQGYEGQIDLIYIDPPFNTGENFNFPNQVRIGSSTFEKELPIGERLAYTDTWNRGVDSFLDMMYPRLIVMRKLLSDVGSIYVHCDQNASHYLRLIMDEIFGRSNFRNEIIWKRTSAHNDPNRFGSIHDTILFYSKTDSYIWNRLMVPHSEEYIGNFYRYTEQGTNRKYRLGDLSGGGSGPARYFGDKLLSPPSGRHWAHDQEGINKLMKEGRIVFSSNGIPSFKRYLDEMSEGQPIQDMWTDINPIGAQAKERAAYPTQKPEELVKRIIEASSVEKSLIADFFCGSGTTAAITEKLNRRWITSDLSKTAIQVTRSRLVNQNTNPFIIQNLGNYQRQLIYAKEVNLKQMYNIILKLYGAAPREDWQGFGISKDDIKSLVFVCEPDRPMTGKKAFELAKQAKTADGKGYKRIVILAWDYEYDFDDSFNRLSKNAKKELSEVEFKIIPSDVYKYLRSTKVGDQELANKITFYQKPYIRLGEPQITNRSGTDIQVKIKIEQYVVMDIPVKDESKRPEIEKLLHKNFANLIDYWTVDWDYDGEVFRSKWQAIRDRKSSEPVPTVADSTLKKGKRYTIAVRVVDVFGNDASMTKEIDLR